MVGMYQSGLGRCDEILLAAPEAKRSTDAVPGHREPLNIAFRQAAPATAAGARQSLVSLRTVASSKPSRIAIKANGRILLIDPADIMVAEAHGNYVLLKQCRGSHMLRERISVFADKLRPYGLIRIHRSVVVNTAHVEAVEPLLTGEYLLRMKSGKEYKASRTYKRNLQFLAAAWVGTEGFAKE